MKVQSVNVVIKVGESLVGDPGSRRQGAGSSRPVPHLIPGIGDPSVEAVGVVLGRFGDQPEEPVILLAISNFCYFSRLGINCYV